MKVKVTANVLINNEHKQGDEFTVTNTEGERLINLGVAQAVEEVKQAPKRNTRKKVEDK